MAGLLCYFVGRVGRVEWLILRGLERSLLFRVAVGEIKVYCIFMGVCYLFFFFFFVIISLVSFF